MELVIDTNKVIASIITSGKVRKIFVFSHFKLFAPKYLIFEINKHKESICNRFKIDKDHFEFIKDEIILPNIILVEEELYKNKIFEAYEIAKRFDEKDTPFIALALKLNVPIWTNDKKIIEFGLKTGKYLALDTKAVGDLIKGRSLEEVREDLKGRFR